MLLYFVFLIPVCMLFCCTANRRHDRRICTAACFMLFLCVGSAASAGSVQNVPKDRISVRMPVGMEAQIHTEDGLLHLTIDSRKTDWGRVLLQGNDPSAADVVAGIKPPAGAVGHVLVCGSENDDSIALDWLNDEDPEDFPKSTLAENGQTVAECVNDLRIIMPYNESTYLYVRWFDDQDKEVCTEKLHFTSAHTMSQGLYAPLYQIHSEAILPNCGSQSGVTANVHAGMVTYTCTRKPASSDERILTGVCVPEGTKTCNLLSLRRGNESLPIKNGMVQIATAYPWTGAKKATFGLEFLDENGDLLDCGLLSVQHQTTEMSPWPTYIKSWEPVPQDNFQLTISGNSSVRMPYEQGILSYDFAQIAEDTQTLEESDVSISVIPPPNAKYVRQNACGGLEGLLGVHSYGQQETDEWMNDENKDEKVNGPVSVGQRPILRSLHTYDGVTLFVPTVPTDLDSGMVYILYWYDSEESLKENQPFEVWWFAEKSAPYIKVTENKARKTETSLPDHLSGAIVIGEENWIVVTESYLQEGENAQHYELRLTDENGNTVSPGRNTVVYLPYPDGLSYDDAVTYTLRHYDANGGSEIVTTLTPTAIGLRFEAESFSPFVLQWEEQSGAADAPVQGIDDLPETGDTSSVVPLLLLILSASASLCLMLRRRCM